MRSLSLTHGYWLKFWKLEGEASRYPSHQGIPRFENLGDLGASKRVVKTLGQVE